MKRFYIISLILIIIDRIIKMLVQTFLSGNPIYIIKKFFYLIYVQNEGAAFSMLEGRSFSLVIIAVIAATILTSYIRKYNCYNKIGYMMLFSGIIGNMIDRLFYGYVIDYLGFILFGKYMPIFNFADILIVLGVGMILLGSDKNENRSKYREGREN